MGGTSCGMPVAAKIATVSTMAANSARLMMPTRLCHPSGWWRTRSWALTPECVSTTRNKVATVITAAPTRAAHSEPAGRPEIATSDHSSANGASTSAPRRRRIQLQSSSVASTVTMTSLSGWAGSAQPGKQL